MKNILILDIGNTMIDSYYQNDTNEFFFTIERKGQCDLFLESYLKKIDEYFLNDLSVYISSVNRPAEKRIVDYFTHKQTPIYSLNSLLMEKYIKENNFTINNIAFLGSDLFADIVGSNYKNNKAELVGYMGVWNIVDEAHITTIAVKEDFRRMHIAEALIANSVNPQADFVLPIRVGLLDKYYKIEGEKFSLYILNGEEAQKTYLTAEEINGIKNDKQNLHKYYRRYLLTNTPDKNFENYIKKEFLKSNDVVIITDRTISMFTGEQIRMIIHSGNYEKFPIQFLRLSKLNNDLLYTASKNLKLKQHLNVKNWEIFVFGI